ncbi:MAG: insulinase family protein, partial [Vibrio sp.]
MHVSPNDHKQYRQLNLANGMRVLLIQDQTAHKASAALAVRVGHYDDPTSRQGLAHFLEHMLFLGTDKYPKVGDFQAFISRNGGSNNAWTGTEHTCFFFDINPQAYPQAVDRFSQFFIAPTFDPDALDKERHAVQSEFELKYKDEMRRQYQVHKEVINPEHPFAKFSVGNLETLSDQGQHSIRDEVMAFYHNEYSADLMTLVLAAPQDLDALQALAEEKFSPVVNRSLAHKHIKPSLWREQDKQIFVHIEPEKDSRKLSLAFLFPSMDAFYQTKPLSYFAHILGDESPGSLLQYLKDQNLITSLSAGGGISGNNFREFTISCALTQFGLTQVDRIIEAIFYYIECLKHDGIAKWRYDEKSAVLESAFRFQETGRLIDLTSHLAMNLQLFAPDDVIYGDYMMRSYDEAHLKQLAQHLSAENLRVTLVAKKRTQKNTQLNNAKQTSSVDWDNDFDISQDFDRTALWYHTSYRVAPFTAKQKQRWQQPQAIDEIYLPKPNPYICTNFNPTPVEKAQTHPELVQELDGFRLWHMQDSEFNVPKGVVFIAIDSPHAVSTTRTIVKTRLCVEMFLDALGQETYQAEIAGMGYNLYAHQGGVTLMLTGFSQKQPQLLEVIVNKFSGRGFSQSRFDSIKTQLGRYWKNAQKDRPVSQLFNAMSGLLQPNNPPYADLARELETIHVEELAEFVNKMLCELHV